MKTSRLFPICAFILSTAVACKGGSPEGTYKIDKAATKKSMEAEIAKMPADQQGMAKMGIAMLEAMEVSIKLTPDGKTEMTSSMTLEAGKPAKTKTEAGTWTKSEDTITVTGGKEPMTCKLESKQLNCSGAKGQTLSFIKE